MGDFLHGRMILNILFIVMLMMIFSEEVLYIIDTDGKNRKQLTY